MDCSSRVALYLCCRGRAAAADGVSAQARGAEQVALARLPKGRPDPWD